MTTRHRDGVSEMYQSMCKQLLACQNNSKHNPTECFPDATEGPSVCRSCTPDEATTEAPETLPPIPYWAENNFFTFFCKLSNKPIFVVEYCFLPSQSSKIHNLWPTLQCKSPTLKIIYSGTVFIVKKLFYRRKISLIEFCRENYGPCPLVSELANTN